MIEIVGGFDNGGQLLESTLRHFALRDVLLHGDEVADLALRVPDRRDGLFLCVEATASVSIDGFTAPDVPGQDRIPQILIERLIVLIRLDEVSGILAHGFCGRISGEV